MTERLANAKFKRIKEYYSAMGGLDPDIQEDVRWLINRVEELEKELNKQMNIGLKFEDEANELQKQNKRYREALEFYAERDNYQWEVSYRPQQEIDCMVIDDSGYIARQVLKGE